MLKQSKYRTKKSDLKPSKKYSIDKSDIPVLFRPPKKEIENAKNNKLTASGRKPLKWLVTLTFYVVVFFCLIAILTFLAPSNLLLTVPSRYFCCVSSVLHIVSVCIRSSAI